MKTSELENRIQELELELSKLKSDKEEARSATRHPAEDKGVDFLSLGNSIPAHIAYVNIETLKYEYVNDLFEESFGIPKQKIVGSHIKEIIGEKNYQYALSFIKEVKQGKSCTFENSYDLASGKRWIQVNYSPVFHDNKKVIGVASVSYDITKRKHADEVLSRTSNYINKLNQFALGLSDLTENDTLEAFITKQAKEVAGAEMAIFNEYDSDKKTTTPRHIELESGLLNKALDLLGTKIQNIHSVISDKVFREMTTEMIGIRKTLFDISFGAVPRPVSAAIQALLKVDRFIGISYLLEGKLYGTIILAMGVGKPDPPKEILKSFIHLASVSLKRKQSDKALKESEEKFRSIMENSADAIFITDQQGKYVYTNKTASSMLGYTSEEFKNMSIADIRVAKNEKESDKGFKQIINDGKGSYEVELRKKDGNSISTDLNSVVLPNGLVYGSCRDITDRKKAEQSLKENERKLVQLNDDKDRFISILAHDLKSPFNNLLGFSGLLTKNIRTYDIEKTEQFVKLIDDSARNIHDLLNDLLMWANSQQGSIPFGPMNLSFADVCKDVLCTSNSSADEKNITINCLAGDHFTVYADADMLKTIMRNLVSNAVKFTNNGGAINITAEQNSENVSISVSDNGVGIPPEKLEKLFDISEVMTTEGTNSESGTGLGLLLCKEFVGKHGGKIWAKSEEGKGSEFKFTLPVSI